MGAKTSYGNSVLSAGLFFQWRTLAPRVKLLNSHIPPRSGSCQQQESGIKRYNLNPPGRAETPRAVATSAAPSPQLPSKRTFHGQSDHRRQRIRHGHAVRRGQEADDEHTDLRSAYSDAAAGPGHYADGQDRLCGRPEGCFAGGEYGELGRSTALHAVSFALQLGSTLHPALSPLPSPLKARHWPLPWGTLSPPWPQYNGASPKRCRAPARALVGR